MAGKIKGMIDSIIAQRSHGDSTLVLTTTTKLVIKGFNPDQYTAQSPDDADVIGRLKEVAQQLGVNI